jgi:hypothetical protein
MKILYIALLSLFFLQVNAQICTFTDDEIDSVGIINPGPYDEDTNPEGGIDLPACINESYEFKFVLYVPPQVNFQSIPVFVDSIKLNGEGISGLPSGLDEVLNNPNQAFLPGQADCILIQGTPDESNVAGDYTLRLNVSVWLRGLGKQDFVLPDPLITGEGEYILELRNEGACTVSSAEEDIRSQNTLDLAILTNPVTTDLKLEINSKSYNNIQIELVNMFGQRFLNKQYDLYPGNNRIEMDCRGLSQGIYFIRYRDEFNERTKRFYIIRP